MNKKGQSMQGWIEGISVAVLFVLVFTVIVVNMNDLYSKDHSIEGLPTGDFYDRLKNQQDSMEQKFGEGEASFLGGVALTISTSWDILFGTMTMLWSFITGGWIETIIVGYLPLGDSGIYLSYILRALFFLSVGFIMLKILFNRNQT